MHILLTDLLTCPRCGPEYGLILVAERVEDRRVLAGALGCSNCREKYRVRHGAAWLGDRESGGAGERGPGERESGGTGEQRANAGGSGKGSAGSEGVEGDGALRLAALLGVTRGPGFLLLAGPAGRHASAIAALLEDVEVVVASRAGDAGASAGAGGARVTRLVLDGDAPRLPLAGGKLLAVALTGEAADTLLEDGARVVSPVGRLVLDPAPADAAARLARVRMRPIAEAGGVVVAGRDPRV